MHGSQAPDAIQLHLIRRWRLLAFIVKIDLIVQKDTKVIPIEVKAEINTKSKSLKTYIEKNPELKGLRLSMLSYEDQGWMENKPLYAVNFAF